MRDKIKKSPPIRFAGFTDTWEQRKLGELTQIKTGASDLQDAVDDGQYPFFVRSENVERSNKYLFDGEAILIPGEGRLGEIYHYINGKFDYHQRVYKISDFNNYTNGKFILYTMQSTFKKHAMRYTVKATVDSLRLPMLSEYQLMVPDTAEQQQIGAFFSNLDNIITLHQRKLELLKETKKAMLQKMFPKDGEIVPEIRFAGFTDAWEQRKLRDEFYKVNERNDGSFGKEHWISVAKMYFQDPEKVQSNNIDTRTYVMRFGDIAFEGHPNQEFKFGRFVANDIGDGVVSEVFPIYRHKQEYDNDFWKRAIQIERIMAPIFAKSITSSGNSSNKLDEKHFLRECLTVPSISEQKQIGTFFRELDNLIALHQRELDLLKDFKKLMLQQMFI